MNDRRGAARPTAVIAALGAILPRAEQTWLLRASLHRGDAGRAAWRSWRSLAGDAKAAVVEDRWGVKRLVPLLFDGLRRNGADVDPALMPYLRAIYAREQMRTRTYLRICGEVLAALDAEAIPAVLLRGAAAAATLYDDPALRHCHDISLLVSPADLGRAAAALRRRGLAPMGPEPRAGASDVYLRHESTLPVELHTRLFEVPLYDLPMAEVWPRTREAAVAGRSARVLAPTDALLHLCGHASYSPSRNTLRWLCDAWHLLRRHPDLDWHLLIETARRSRLMLPLAVTLGYLADDLGAPVPERAVQRAHAAARHAGGVERDVALRGARAGVPESIGEVLRSTPGGWRVKACVLAWLLFPSPRYVADMTGARGPARVCAQYAIRPVRIAHGLARERLRTRRERRLRAFGSGVMALTTENART